LAPGLWVVGPVGDVCGVGGGKMTAVTAPYRED
jgi:hypothetical protein